MVDIEYPTFTSKIGIDPLLCRVDNDADNIFDLEVNGNLCDKQKGHDDSCKGDNVFIKQSMTNRLNNKYGDNTFINNNKNKIIAMMKHPNYSKSLCHNTLNKGAYVDKMTYSQAVLPYNYEYCDKNSPCNDYKNTIYEKTNTIPHNMVNYGSKDDTNTSLSSEIFNNESNNNIVKNNNELCNNFYKVYCEKLNSMLKDKFGDKFDTSMLGEYENMCLCYQDLYKDYLPARVYKGFYGKNEEDITNIIANNEIKPILENGAKMISPVCDYTQTQNGTTKGRYAPITNKNWNSDVSINIAICNNTLNMNDTNIESNDESTIKFNQSSLCSTNGNPTPDNTPKTDDKTSDKSDITDIKDNTEIKESETKDNELSNDSDANKDNKDSNINDPNKSNNSNINDPNSNLESTKDKIINKIKENKTYAGIGGGVSLCCCCICCICIIMILSK